MTPTEGVRLDEGELTWKTAPRPTKSKGRDLSAIVRVSQLHGREGDGFMSPEQQIEVMEAQAARHGDRIVKVWDETDSVSGGSVNRVGLQGALNQAMSGETDGVIVARVDRFGRTKRAGEALIYDLVAEGKSFIAAYNNLDTAGKKLDRGTEVYLDVLLRQAEWAREDFIANWIDVRRRHVRNGVAIFAPYGYRKDPTTRKLVKEPTEAKWVVRIFNWRAAGKSWAWIADKLELKGAPRPTPFSEKVQPASRWVPQQVRAIVYRRTYLGELHRGDAHNLVAHKPIITLDQWERAHAAYVVGSADVKADSAFYPLAGKVRCASCGGRMTGVAHTTRGIKRRYYRCRKRYPWGVCPKPAFVPADDLENEVWADFERRALTHVTGSGEREVEVLAAAVAAVEQARAELREFNRSTAAARSEFGDDDFAEGLAERTDRVRRALRAESDARAVSLGAVMPMNVTEDWATWGVQRQATVIGSVYHCVAVRPTTRHKAVEAAAGRMRLWFVGDADAPLNLPGRPIGKSAGPKVASTIRPIIWT
jgi:DNA invertase Pin-like site-specific DNA recombinase